MPEPTPISAPTPTPAPIPAPLQSFLDHNTGSGATVVQSGSNWTIEKPWSDKTLRFSIKASATSDLALFENIKLPAPFSAIWHMDSGDVEFIWGYVPDDTPDINRSFTIKFEGQEHLCEFAPSSETLPKIAKLMLRNGAPTDTNYRNILGIRTWTRPEGESYSLISFWLRGVRKSEQDLLLLARHLNFYMNLYDRSSPKIAILAREVATGLPKLDPKQFGHFPPQFDGFKLDTYLLSLWESGQSSSVFQRFIHNYQIMEFASFYYTRDDLVTQIQRTIRTIPHSLSESEIRKTARKVLEIMVHDKPPDRDKLPNVINRCVGSDNLWTVVKARKDFFSAPTEFEGGLKINPIVLKKTKKNEFDKTYGKNLSDSFRLIRNALVHSRQKMQAHTLHPTIENERLLEPWLDLADMVAEQLILYKIE